MERFCEEKIYANPVTAIRPNNPRRIELISIYLRLSNLVFKSILLNIIFLIVLMY
jgi:hypothetical protein